jgi:hypothetical protein
MRDLSRTAKGKLSATTTARSGYRLSTLTTGVALRFGIAITTLPPPAANSAVPAPAHKRTALSISGCKER